MNQNQPLVSKVSVISCEGQTLVMSEVLNCNAKDEVWQVIAGHG